MGGVKGGGHTQGCHSSVCVCVCVFLVPPLELPACSQCDSQRLDFQELPPSQGERGLCAYVRAYVLRRSHGW